MEDAGPRLRIRYFPSATPRDEGSVVECRDPPGLVTGPALLDMLAEQRVPLAHHRPQVYDPRVRGYRNLSVF